MERSSFWTVSMNVLNLNTVFDRRFLSFHFARFNNTKVLITRHCITLTLIFMEYIWYKNVETARDERVCRIVGSTAVRSLAQPPCWHCAGNARWATRRCQTDHYQWWWDSCCLYHVISKFTHRFQCNKMLFLFETFLKTCILERPWNVPFSKYRDYVVAIEWVLSTIYFF